MGAVALTGALGRLALADDAKQAVCPVSGQAAKTGPDAPSISVNGQAVNFCCENCPKAFMADPDKFVSKMDLKCPVMKANAVKPNKDMRMAVNNGYVYFCCGGCPAAFAKAPEKFISELKDPVTGETFKLSAGAPHTAYKNAHFYFANAQNKAAFEADPVKYVKIAG
jgi:YHS domain-containing protein